jgi:hypothetical protein
MPNEWSSCGVAGDKSMAWKLDRGAPFRAEADHVLSVIQALAEALVVE